jgi:hypothetical protein
MATIKPCTLCAQETMYPAVFIWAGQVQEACPRCFDVIAEHEASGEEAVRELIQCAVERDYESAVRP